MTVVGDSLFDCDLFEYVSCAYKIRTDFVKLEYEPTFETLMSQFEFIEDVITRNNYLVDFENEFEDMPM